MYDNSPLHPSILGVPMHQPHTHTSTHHFHASSSHSITQVALVLFHFYTTALDILLRSHQRITLTHNMASRNGSKFRTTVWDPWLILAQIAALQSCYYTILCLVMLLIEALTGQDTALAHILDYRLYRGDNAFGWILGLGVMCCSLASMILLQYIVERARLCLDFVVTLHFIHLICTAYYSGHVPTTVFWWALNLASCCVMSISGEWACMRRELEPIMLSGAQTNTRTNETSRIDTNEDATQQHATLIAMDEFSEHDAYTTEEENTGRGRVGAMGKRVARLVGEHKRKRSGASYEIVPQTVTTATKSSNGDATNI
jgi:hypothetical protein